MADKWLTIDQIADHLQVSKEKVYKLCQRGRMPASKLGGQWRFNKDLVDQWMLESQTAYKQAKAGKRKSGKY